MKKDIPICPMCLRRPGEVELRSKIHEGAKDYICQKCFDALMEEIKMYSKEVN